MVEDASRSETVRAMDGSYGDRIFGGRLFLLYHNEGTETNGGVRLDNLPEILIEWRAPVRPRACVKPL